MIKKKIKNEEVANLSNATIYHFPKYTTMIVNLVNGTAQATRPKVVGQMSDLIQEFDGKTLDEWIEWYSARMPNAIDAATKKISSLMSEIKKAVELIDDELIENWVKDLVYNKTFCGLKVQQAILSYIASMYGKEWRLASKEEEAKGIDGFIGESPAQIKAETYKQKGQLNEVIKVPIIYYEKKKDGLNIEFDPEVFSV